MIEELYQKNLFIFAFTIVQVVGFKLAVSKLFRPTEQLHLLQILWDSFRQCAQMKSPLRTSLTPQQLLAPPTDLAYNVYTKILFIYGLHFCASFWSCYDPRHYASGSFVLDISLVYLSVVTAIGEQVQCKSMYKSHYIDQLGRCKMSIDSGL